MSERTVILAKGISNKYGDREILQNVNFGLEEGDFLVLFGADDAGKTTLLRILMGFQTSYSGAVRLWGKKPNRLTGEKRGWLRFVPDDILWEEKQTGEEYLSYVRRASAAYDKEYQDRLCELFKVTLEEGLLDTSYQNNKLVQIIGALCARPRLILLDEPSRYLSRDVCRILYDLLREHCRQGGSVLLTENQYEKAREYCNRVIYLKEGKVIIYRKVSHPDIRCKAVTVRGGKEEYLSRYLPGIICDRGMIKTYLYKGDMKKLAQLLYHAECQDWTVEELTLTEELEGDYARWK